MAVAESYKDRKGGPGDVDVIGARIGAQLVDLVAMFVLALVLAFGLVSAAGGSGARLLFFLVFFGVAIGYGTVLEGVYGKTFGKILTDVRVVDRRGADIGFGKAFVRNIPALFGGWATWLVGMAAIAMNDDNQRLFDQAADTYVVADGNGTAGAELSPQQRDDLSR